MARALALILAFCLLATTACNTWEGFGKDLRKLGGKIEKSADEKDD